MLHGFFPKNNYLGTSLVVQWLRICLATQGKWIWSLVGELRSHMPRGNDPKYCNERAHLPHLLSPCTTIRESMCLNERSHPHDSTKIWRKQTNKRKKNQLKKKLHCLAYSFILNNFSLKLHKCQGFNSDQRKTSLSTSKNLYKSLPSCHASVFTNLSQNYR